MNLLDSKLVAMTAPNSVASEQYRSLRTNLEFLSVTNQIRTIQVTSGVPGAGKSLTAANLALVMAQAGHRTLLLDADLRRPSIHHLFSGANLSGLTTAITHFENWEQYVMPSPLSTLSVLTSGPIPPNPSEMLGSPHMHHLLETFKTHFEFVVIDTPPVVAYTDAVVLSQLVDGTIFVVRAGYSSRQADLKGKERLAQVNARVLGIVLNALNLEEDTSLNYY